jgi:hypothetical protein
MTLFASLMAIVSWAFSVGVHATCFFVQGDDEKQTGFGIWTMENVIPTPANDYQCVEYTFAQTHLMDTKWNSAAGMAYSAGLIGFIFGVFLVGSSCAAYSRAFFKLAGVNYIVAGILDLLTLIGVQSDICTIFTADYPALTDTATQCTFSTGAILAIIAGVCYFITAGICFCMPAARNDDSDDGNANKSAALAQQAEEGEDDVENNGNVNAAAVDTAAPVEESDAAIIEDGISGQSFWIMLFDNLLFVTGSVFFMWLAVMDLDWAKTVNMWVEADLIDGNFNIRDNAIDELKNYTWADDDYVFETRTHWVSLYQIVYFIAGAAFLIEGFLEFFVTPGFQGIWFTFAGGTGLLAAWLGERDVDLSSIFSLISSCAFVVEAVGLVWNRSNFTGRLKRIVWINDICFVIATTIDVVLGFTEVFKIYKMSLVRTGTASAALWLFCSAVYLGLTLYAKRKGYFDKQDSSTSAKEQTSASDGEEAAPEEQATNSSEPESANGKEEATVEEEEVKSPPESE